MNIRTYTSIEFTAIALSNNVVLNVIDSRSPSRNAPLSIPPMELSILSARPFKRLWRRSAQTWLAGKMLHTVLTLEENLESGIYAPITKPAAAESSPKNAAAADEVFRNWTTVMNRALDDRQPKNITPYALIIFIAVRCMLPAKLRMIRPVVNSNDVMMNEEITAATR